MVWTRRIKEILKRNIDQPSEVYLALAIGAGQISAVTWAVTDKTIDIFGQGAASFSTDEDLLTAVEPAVELAFNSKSPKKFFVGVPPEWTIQSRFSEKYGNLLQEIIDRLDLPLGGVVLAVESLTAYLKNLKAISSAVLVEVGRFKLRVSIMGAGRALPSFQEDREDENLGGAIEALLNKIDFKSSLPSHLILYGPGALEENRQEVLKHSWSEEIFRHAPSATLLEDTVLAEAVAYVSAINLSRPAPYLKRTGAESSPLRPGVGETDQASEDKERSWATQPEIDTVGYQLDQDVVTETFIPPQEELPPPSRKTTSDSLGLIKSISIPIIRFIQGLRPGGRIPPWGSLALLTFLVGGLLVLALPRARVTLLVQPQTLEGSFPLLMTTQSLEREDERVVKMVKKEVDLEDEKEMSTTGVKLIGEAAKGEVVVFNRTLIAKTFAAGSILVGQNDLRFTLDSPVTVDAAMVATGSGSETKTYGRAKIGITASEIGAEGNLAGGSRLSFLSYSEEQYFAESEEAFSGGSSREVKVVTQDDQEKITQELEEKIRQRAKDLIGQEVNSDLKPIEDKVDLTVVEKKFSAEPGNEVDTLNLRVQARAFGYLYHQAEVLGLIEKEVEKQIRGGYQAVKDQAKFDLSYDEWEEEETRAQVNFETVILPDFDQDEVKRQVSGKKPEVAKDILQALPHVEEVRLEIWPGQLPKVLLRMPLIQDRIEVRIAKR
jgi:hypothetical protein